jgi:S1-C subfamily serine protease
MRNVRLLVLTVVLVAVLGLSACTVALPGAIAGLGALSGGLNSLVSRQTASTQPAAPVNVVLQSAPPPVNVGDLQAALEQVYQAANPSVVNIRVTITGGMQQLQGLPEMPNMPGLPFPFGQGTPDQGTPDQGQSAPKAQAEGSGFVWDKQGDIVTNNHVVDGAEDITVTFSDGTSLPAKLVGRDPDSDLAVIKIDASKVDLQPVTVADSTQVKPGQFVVAIGNPFGLANSMSFGIVSALGRTLPASGETSATATAPSYTIPDIIQTDAPVNPGNSGGVLLDLAGNLVGVPTAIESPVRGSAGVGFAVPSAIVQQVVPELIEKGRFEHPYIGISGGTITSEMAKAMGLPDTQRGALVVNVTKGSPAEQAGLQGSTQQVDINGEQVKVGGDVITAINGQPVKDFEDLVTYLARFGKVGQKVELTIVRDGKDITVSVTLAARPGAKTETANSDQPSQPQTTSGGAWLGVSGVTVTAEIATAMDLGQDQKGALIENVTSGGPADKAGLQGSFKAFDLNGQQIMIGGDVVTAVDGKSVATMQELAAAIQAKQAGDKVELTVLRNGNETKVEVTLAARQGAQAAPAPKNSQPEPQQPQQPRATRGGAWLGISGLNLTPEMATAMNLAEDQQGALIEDVTSGSPAEKAGLQGSTKAFDLNGQQVNIGGDVVTAVDGKSVATMQDLSAAIRAKKVGDQVELTVLRDGNETKVEVTLGARPAQSN